MKQSIQLRNFTEADWFGFSNCESENPKIAEFQNQYGNWTAIADITGPYFLWMSSTEPREFAEFVFPIDECFEDIQRLTEVLFLAMDTDLISGELLLSLGFQANKE